MTVQARGRDAPAPTRAYVDAQGRYVRERAGARTIVQADGSEVRWATAEYVPEDLLKRLKHSRDQERRAPLGDAKGAWVKIAELPLSFLMSKLPPDAWEDKRALRKIINDPDLRYFRADSSHKLF